MLRKKRKARFVFSVSLFYTFSMYVILCLSTSIFFGPSISPIVTLNWERYSGGAKHGTAIPWWASGLSYMVLLFPVVSVSAAFPLQLVVISGEITQAFPCRLMLHLHRDSLTALIDHTETPSYRLISRMNNFTGILSKAFGGSGPPGPWSHAPLRIMCCFVAVCLAQGIALIFESPSSAFLVYISPLSCVHYREGLRV